jgi:hypothetical protein
LIEVKENPMSAAWRASNAVIAAALGWTATWVFILLLSTVPMRHATKFDWGWVMIYLLCTGAVTALVTVVLILPYVCLRSSESILRRPWRMYLEPCLLGALCISVFDLYYGPTAETTRQKLLSPFLCFALLTSLASSYFFLRRLRKKITRNHQSVDKRRASRLALDR